MLHCLDRGLYSRTVRPWIRPAGLVASYSSMLPPPPQMDRAVDVPSNSSHVVEPASRWVRRRLWTFQVPIRKSKSCWPSRSAFGSTGIPLPPFTSRWVTTIAIDRPPARNVPRVVQPRRMSRPSTPSVAARVVGDNSHLVRIRYSHYDRGVKRVAAGLVPAIAVDRVSGKPLYRQLYEGYRDAILEQRLRGGQRLPSTRSLAAELGISRIPVLGAFEQLVAEGYFESRVGAGTFVSRSLPADRPGSGGRARVGPTARSGRTLVARGPAIRP